MNTNVCINIAELDKDEKREAIKKIIKALQSSQSVNWGS